MRSLFFLLLFLSSTAFAQVPKRIVTAGSAISEIVYALGHGSSIVATDQASKYPAALQQLPSLGYRNSITAEGILSQNADLILLEKDYVKSDVIDVLKNTGKKVLVLEQHHTIENTKKNIRTIAQALGTTAEPILSRMQADLEAVSQKVAQTKDRPRVLCVYARGQGNMHVVGPDSFFSIIELAGCQNAVPEIQGYKPLNAEALIAANPDFILLFEAGLASLGGVQGVLSLPGVAQTTAGKKQQIIALEGSLLTNWGPRLAQAVEELFRLTHPNTHGR